MVREGLVFFGCFLNQNDLNMFSDYGGEEVKDFKGIRERELDRDHGLGVGYEHLRFQSGICSGSFQATKYISHVAKTLWDLPTSFRIRNNILPRWPVGSA